MPRNGSLELSGLLSPVLKQGTLARGFRGKAVLISSRRVEELAVGVPGDAAQGSYRDWTFPTRVERIRGQYFEEWIRSDRQGWELKHICFHLFRVESPRAIPKEIVAVHSEPGEDGVSFSSKLKKGPHLHVKAAGDIIGEAHFPLCLSCLESVLSSTDCLMNAIRELIEVLAVEVIDRH